MASRPRRSAATKAQETISVHARWADSSDKKSSRESTMPSRRSNRVVRDDPDSADDSSHMDVTVKVPGGKLRQATRGSSRRSDTFDGGEIVTGKRDRGGKKKYVVDSSPEEDDEDEEEPQLDDDDEEDEEDAEGEDEMDVDAEGEEEDAEGDIDMDIAPAPRGPTIKISRAATSKSSGRAAASRVVPDEDEEDDDDELSDPAESEAGDQTLGAGDDDDVEGEIEVNAGDDDDEDDEDDDEGEAGGGGQGGESEDLGSQDEEPDLTKMTKRQRARFEEEPQEYMKLSDEVQAKKVFTAEELSMRRQEMARRRRNLSEKRTEEVKMETINKLLKKQAPKVSKKAATAQDGSPEDESSKVSSVFIRWTSTKDGSRVAVPGPVVGGPVGKVFKKGGLAPGKMVEEVA